KPNRRSQPIDAMHRTPPEDLPLRRDAEPVPDDQHPDHQHRVDRRSANLRVVGCEPRIDPGKVQQTPNFPYQMIVGNRLIEPELVKELSLALVAPPHHLSPRRESRAETESR